MLAAARSGNWDEVVKLEERPARMLIACSSRTPPPTTPAPMQAEAKEKSRIMQRILLNDAEIRHLAEPWLDGPRPACWTAAAVLHFFTDPETVCQKKTTPCSKTPCPASLDALGSATDSPSSASCAPGEIRRAAQAAMMRRGGAQMNSERALTAAPTRYLTLWTVDARRNARLLHAPTWQQPAVHDMLLEADECVARRLPRSRQGAVRRQRSRAGAGPARPASCRPACRASCSASSAATPSACAHHRAHVADDGVVPPPRHPRHEPRAAAMLDVSIGGYALLQPSNVHPACSPAP